MPSTTDPPAADADLAHLSQAVSGLASASALTADAAYTKYIKAPQSAALEQEMSAWVQRAAKGAVVEKVLDGDGTISGYCAVHPRCEGAIAFGDTPDDALGEFPSVLYGWLEVGLRFDDPIPEM